MFAKLCIFLELWQLNVYMKTHFVVVILICVQCLLFNFKIDTILNTCACKFIILQIPSIEKAAFSEWTKVVSRYFHRWWKYNFHCVLNWSVLDRECAGINNNKLWIVMATFWQCCRWHKPLKVNVIYFVNSCRVRVKGWLFLGTSSRSNPHALSIGLPPPPLGGLGREEDGSCRVLSPSLHWLQSASLFILGKGEA